MKRNEDFWHHTRVVRGLQAPGWYHNAQPHDKYDHASVMDPEHLQELTAAALSPEEPQQ